MTYHKCFYILLSLIFFLCCIELLLMKCQFLSDTKTAIDFLVMNIIPFLMSNQNLFTFSYNQNPFREISDAFLYVQFLDILYFLFKMKEFIHIGKFKTIITLVMIQLEGSPHGIMVKVLDCSLKVSKFEN